MDPICSGEVGHAASQLSQPGTHPCARRPVPASVLEQRRAGIDSAVSGVLAELSEDETEVIVRLNAPRAENRRA